MPLPSDPNAPWPPKTWQPIQHDAEEAAVWYAGTTQALEQFYGSSSSGPRRPSDKGTVKAALQRFWSRRAADDCTDRQRIHVPAAADIAATSADLLFGETPRLTIPEAHGETRDKSAMEVEERLAELADLDGTMAKLLEGAEVCAGIGDVYLRVVWDQDVAPHPMLDIVHGDHAVPEFRWGHLVAVTFWRIVETDGAGNVWRHLERYEPGSIQHGLYVGKRDALGKQVDLTAHTSTAVLEVNEHGVIEFDPALRGQLLARHVPNVRPNRQHRWAPIGRSDTAGNEGLMDALDETYTAWMREIRLVKPRIVVPQDFLDRRGRGAGATFDVDNEIFTPLEMEPKAQEKAGITVAEFELHTDKYLASCMALFERIVVGAGYSSATFGMGGDTTEITATEVRARENRTLRTTGRKERYWGKPVEDAAELLLIVDKVMFKGKVEPMRPRLDFEDGIPDDPRQTAETIELLRRAQAISTATAVRMAQPDLEGEELKAEVQRVLDETGMQVPDPALFGRGAEDPADGDVEEGAA